MVIGSASVERLDRNPLERRLWYSYMVALALTVSVTNDHHRPRLDDQILQLTEHSVLIDNFLSTYWLKTGLLIIFWLCGIIMPNGVFGLVQNFFLASNISFARAFCIGTFFSLPL